MAKLLNSSIEIFFKLYPDNKDCVLFGGLNRAFTSEECIEIAQYISTTELKRQVAVSADNTGPSYIKEWIDAVNRELFEREIWNKKRLKLYK